MRILAALIMLGFLTTMAFADHPEASKPPMVVPPPASPEAKNKINPKKKPKLKATPLVIPKSRSRRRVVKAHNCYPTDTFFAMMMKIEMRLAMAGVEQSPTEAGMVHTGWAQVWIDKNRKHYVIASLTNQRGNNGYICILSKGIAPTFDFNVLLPSGDGGTLKIVY